MRTTALAAGLLSSYRMTAVTPLVVSMVPPPADGQLVEHERTQAHSAQHSRFFLHGDVEKTC
jgi:hypothetical protein